MSKTIAEVKFIKEGKFDPTKVLASFSDGSEKCIFSYFEDEINFSSDELIGLTEEEAEKFRLKKDTAYLRS